MFVLLSVPTVRYKACPFVKCSGAAAVYGVFLVSSCCFLVSSLCNFQYVYALCIGDFFFISKTTLLFWRWNAVGLSKPANCQLCACHQFCPVSIFLSQCANWGLMTVIVKNDVRMLCDLLIFCLFQLCFWVLEPIPRVFMQWFSFVQRTHATPPAVSSPIASPGLPRSVKQQKKKKEKTQSTANTFWGCSGKTH